MQSIFRVPVDNQHFRDTIETGKPFNEVASFLSGDERAKLQRISRDGFVRFWGSLPGEGNKNYFKKLQENDELLCYRSGRYIAVCKIAFTTVNPDLAKYAWGVTDTEKTWELIYFFNSVSTFEIDSRVINQEFDFKDDPVMGFGAISTDRAEKFLAKYGSVETYIQKFKDEKQSKSISEEIAKIKIASPYEAQFYLVDLGNQLDFDTYVPPSDAGRPVFGKKLDELITVRKNELSAYVIPKIFDPLSNIDVIWFGKNYKPKYFFEVIHSTGMNEAFGRLKAVADFYETAKTKIIGTQKAAEDFEKSKRLYFPNSDKISYKHYDELINVHSETLYHQKLVQAFLQ